MSKLAAFRLYPRGFLGGKIAPQVERTNKPFASDHRQLQFTLNDHDTAKTAIAPNTLIEELYSQKLKQMPGFFTPDFHLRVMQEGLRAFGTKNFQTWYEAQHQSPACGVNHNAFLTDTLRYIETGRREQPLETWQAIVTMTDEGNNIGEVSKLAKEFFGQPERHRVADVLRMWVMNGGGVTDLLGTLHILFGNP